MSDARAYAQRNQRGSDWFSHDGSAANAAPSPPKPAPVAPAEPKPDEGAQGNRAQMIKPKCESNNWFKHEHDGSAAAAAGAGEPAVTATEVAPVAVAAPEAQHPAAAVGGREGDANAKRAQAGSSASWFSHDHGSEAAAQHGPRVTTKEGGANASRMRGESENWFSYDAAKDQQDVHVGKARSARPQTDSMSQIFNQK